VLCACAPPLRPLPIRITKSIISSLTLIYEKSSRAGYASKDPGMLSSAATAPSAVVANPATNIDYELEKISGKVDIEESTQADVPRRKWSKSWKRGGGRDLELSTSPNRLAILESHSFEVRHENRQQVASRPSQEPYMRLDDTANDLHDQRLARDQSSSSKMLGHRHYEPTPKSRLGAHEQAPTLGTPTPLSPLGGSFVEAQSTLVDRVRPDQDAMQSPQQDSFYISQASNSGDNISGSERSEQWPLQPTTVASRLEPRNGERRWNIERNPFRDRDRKIASDSLTRVATSGGLPDPVRRGSDPNVWDDIRARKKAMSMQRSGSLKEKPRGIARML
jgi:hypothetical protein